MMHLVEHQKVASKIAALSSQVEEPQTQSQGHPPALPPTQLPHAPLQWLRNKLLQQQTQMCADK